MPMKSCQSLLDKLYRQHARRSGIDLKADLHSNILDNPNAAHLLDYVYGIKKPHHSMPDGYLDHLPRCIKRNLNTPIENLESVYSINKFLYSVFDNDFDALGDFFRVVPCLGLDATFLSDQSDHSFGFIFNSSLVDMARYVSEIIISNNVVGVQFGTGQTSQPENIYYSAILYGDLVIDMAHKLLAGRQISKPNRDQRKTWVEYAFWGAEAASSFLVAHELGHFKLRHDCDDVECDIDYEYIQGFEQAMIPLFKAHGYEFEWMGSDEFARRFISNLKEFEADEEGLLQTLTYLISDDNSFVDKTDRWRIGVSGCLITLYTLQFIERLYHFHSFSLDIESDPLYFSDVYEFVVESKNTSPQTRITRILKYLKGNFANTFFEGQSVFAIQGDIDNIDYNINQFFQVLWNHFLQEWLLKNEVLSPSLEIQEYFGESKLSRIYS